MRMSRCSAVLSAGLFAFSITPANLNYGKVAVNAAGVRGLETNDSASGVDPDCVMKVVACNYAHLYSGVFSWNSVLKAPNSSTVIVMQADIDGLRVTCSGTETVTDNGVSHVMKSQGNGLVAVEFKNDEDKRPVYNITVACPSPGDADTPSQPAELGHFDQQTYDQLTTAAGGPISPGVDLIGSSTYPNPDNDAVNGVTGDVVVKWSLKHK